MNEGGGTRLTINRTLEASAALLLDLSLKVLVVLNALLAPLEPTAVDIVVIDILIIHECLKLGPKENTMSQRNNSVEGGNERARNLLQFSEPGGKEFGAADGRGQQDQLHRRRKKNHCLLPDTATITVVNIMNLVKDDRLEILK